jgi:hypothetical protein
MNVSQRHLYVGMRHFVLVKMGKAIPVTSSGSPYGCETLRLPNFLDRWTVVRLSALRTGRSLPAGRFLVLISVRGWIGPMAIVRLERLSIKKNSTTSSGIEPATFRFAA